MSKICVGYVSNLFYEDGMGRVVSHIVWLLFHTDEGLDEWQLLIPGLKLCIERALARAQLFTQ